MIRRTSLRICLDEKVIGGVTIATLNDSIISSVLQPFERQSKDVIKKALESDQSDDDSLSALDSKTPESASCTLRA